MRGRGERRSAWAANSEGRVPMRRKRKNAEMQQCKNATRILAFWHSCILALFGLREALLLRRLRFPCKRHDELISFVHELLASPAPVGRTHGVLAEERERDRRVAIGDDGVGQHAWIDLAPADGFGRRRSLKSAPDHLVRRDLDEIVVSTLRDAV